jgi:hypothetical protein
VSFLGQPEVETRLDSLSAAKELTIFAGAGTSMEVGLPSWGGLLDRLLRASVERHKLPDDDADAFLAAAWKDGMGVLGVGSIVRAALGKDPDTYIQKALYATDATSSKIATKEPGPSARNVAQLLPLWRRGAVEIVTTNYDLLLERALEAVFAHRARDGEPSFVGDDADTSSVTAVRPGRSEPFIDEDGVLRVRHLHGALNRTKSADDQLPAVLGERDFYDVLSSDAWQLDWFGARLADTPCLFVGASMTDANVLRFLHASSSGTAALHTALITGARDPLPGVEARDLWKITTSARWAAFGVEALYPDYYADTAAFLDELARRRRRRLDGKRPIFSDRRPERLRRWHRQISKTVLPVGGPRFTAAQDQMTLALTGYLEDARDLLAGSPGVADCHFGLQLWVPDAEGATLVLWGSSQHAWRDSATLAPLSIKPRTKWLSLETWCQGTPTLQDFTPEHGTRWTSALGVPISLAVAPHDGLQVAVATLNVMGQHADGLLRGLPSDELIAVVGYLQEVLSDLLLPRAVTKTSA